MSNYLVCYIVNTVFGKKELYKHFNSIYDVSDFIKHKMEDFSVLDIYVYKNLECIPHE